MTRRCEVLTPDGRWRGTRELRLADVYRIFDAQGHAVQDADGVTRWRVLVAQTLPDEGPWEVDSEQVPETTAEAAVREAGMFWPTGHSMPRMGRLRGS